VKTMTRMAVALLATSVVFGGPPLSRTTPASAAEAASASFASIANATEYQNPALMARAWALPVAIAYRGLPYEYQANPSFCGPTSAANLLHSLGLKATQVSVLRGTNIRAVRGELPEGMTLDQEAALLRTSTHRPVTVLRDLSLEEFRAQIVQANDPSTRYVINFHRGPLFGLGYGHFSPVLGYLAAEDLVFVGDVNRDYRPFLVPVSRLYEAMNTVDFATGALRGLVRVDLPSSAAQGRTSD
jgi:hypothetical protein